MRQVDGLLKVIRQSRVVEMYEMATAFRIAQQKEFPSLQQLLALSSKKAQPEESEFDEGTDKMLEAHALKMLEERRKEYGRQ